MNRRFVSPTLAAFLLPVLFLTQPACGPKEGSGPALAAAQPRNVIFLIGDGMSNAIVSAARIRKGGVSGALNLDRMPVIGLVRTSASNDLITDSAAAATALSTGFKTNNGEIGMNPKGEKLQTILEAAMARGMAGGLVATSAITHATPASFGSHVEARRQQPEIASGLLENKIDVLLGGGYGFFAPQSQEQSYREDDRDLLREAAAAGCTICRTREEMLAAPPGRILGLFARSSMALKSPEPSLPEMAVEAIRRLSPKENGFFLMVEGSQIDFAAHEGDLEKTLNQTLEFDEAIGAALAFAEQDGRTLVIVTSDHETGGLIIKGADLDGSNLEVVWGLLGHNGATVPVYAFGPGAGEFAGFKENTDIPRIIARLLGIKDFPKIY